MAPLLILGAALLFSTGGAAIKATTLNGWQTAGLRSLVAVVALSLLVKEARRGWNLRTAAVGVIYAVTLVLFVLANKLTTSANAIFLQSTAPVYLLFIGPLFLKEPVRRGDVALTVCLGIGMALLLRGTDSPLRTATDPVTGNILAALSGATYAFTLAGLRRHAQSGSGGGAISTVAAGNLIVALLCAPKALPLPVLTTRDLAAVLYLGFAQIGLAYWLLTRGIQRVPAFEASAILLLEPVLNPVWSWLLHGETPGPWTLAGGLVIIGATLTRILADRQR